MKAEAFLVGERLIAQEADLDSLFANRTVTPETLRLATWLTAGSEDTELCFDGAGGGAYLA
jgi:hypothetical protein